MPIENRNLKPGTKLVARYHKQSYSCEVIEGEGGKLRYHLQDGREFKSPSAAGMAITVKSCNGWAFWSVDTAEAAPETEQMEAPTEPAAASAEAAKAPETSDTTTGENKETPVTPAPATEEPASAKKRIFRLPNQKGVPEGQVRWYCHECGSFLSPTGETPKGCPQGHQA